MVKRIFLLLLCLLLLTGVAYASESTITSMDADHKLNEDGSCATSITIQVQFPADVKEFSFAVPTDAKDIAVSGFSFKKTKQSGFTLVTLNNPDGFTGSQNFTIHYRLPETATEDGDTQILSLPLLCPSANTIENFHMKLTLPKTFEAMPSFTSAYYPDVIDNYMDIKITDNVIDIQMLMPVLEQETIVMSIKLPQDFFDLRFLAGKAKPVSAICFWLFFIACILDWFFTLREPFRRIHPQAMLPIGSNPGAIRCQIFGRGADLGLMVLFWAGLGYLSISKTRKGRLSLYRLIEMRNERSDYEISTFSTLFRRSDRCDVGTGIYRSAKEKVEHTSKIYWNHRVFRQHSGSVRLLRILGWLAGSAVSLMSFDCLLPAVSYRWWLILPLTLLGSLACHRIQDCWTLLFRRHRMRLLLLQLISVIYLIAFAHMGGTLHLMCVNLLLQLLVGAAALTGGRRTKSGRSILNELLGLRRYLRTAKADELQIYQQRDPQYFYRTLPYAEALGVGRKFAAKFGNQRLEICDWLDWPGRRAKTALEFYEDFSQILDQLQELDRPRKAAQLRTYRRQPSTGRVSVSATSQSARCSVDDR